MRDAIARLPAFEPKSRLLHVVIDTPKGSRTKYAWKPEAGMFEMRKLLPAGMAFPFDFGFIPGTRTEDGDPLDALVVSEATLFTGCLVKTRLIGGFHARQMERGAKTWARNDRLFAVPVVPTIPHPPRSMRDLDAKLLDDLESFFVTYNALEGRRFEVLSRMDRAHAEQRVKRSIVTSKG
jgi:inorganic pyrophosphatase